MPGALNRAPDRLNVCGSIVTYHPGPRFPEHFAQLMHELPKWLIVDNRSSEDDRQRLRRIARAPVEIIENSDNLGVAAALNQAARRAQALGFEWLLSFDQDSEPEPHLLAHLTEAYRSLPDPDKLGMIGSNFLVEGTGELFYPCYRANAMTVEQPCLITSGSLLSLNAFSQVGPFREELFIDGVDSEYCLRLRRQGFKVMASCRPLMRHRLGNLRIHSLLWKRPRVTHHSPLRRYYMTRNAIVIARQYWGAEREWVRLNLKAVGVGFVGAMLFERHKLKKLGATLLGALDALRGRMGRIDAGWLNS
jgi:rhamnosyltransferase